MKVVSNTGPLSTLGKLGRLDLLIKLYGQVLIPFEVQDEIQVGVQRGFLHSRTLQAMIENRQMRVVEAFASELVFGRPIDKGETGAIRLALQENADLILIDDLNGREEAERLGLQIKGSIGVLLDAFEQGYLSAKEAEHLLETAGVRSDIWISEKLTQIAIGKIRKWRK